MLLFKCSSNLNVVRGGNQGGNSPGQPQRHKLSFRPPLSHWRTPGAAPNPLEAFHEPRSCYLVHDDHRVGSWSNTAVICSMNEPPVGAHTSPSLRNERIESLRSAEPTRVRKCRNLGNLRKFSHRKRTDFFSIDEALSCLPRAYSTCPTAAARHACQARRISRVPAAQDCSGRRRLRSAI